MINDSKGQMSVEVIFIFAISIVVLLVFTVPLTQLAIENNIDIENTLSSKSAIHKIANDIDRVYSQGMGAKQVETIEVNKDISIAIKPKSISTQVPLYNHKMKSISVSHKSDNVICNLKLNKGLNKILISWPENSKSMVISKI